jgi:hypothetical protein
MWLRRALGFGTAVASGLALGYICWLGDQLAYDSLPGAKIITWIGNSASPWLLLAFFLGMASASRRWAALYGGASLACAVGSYYGIILLTDSRAAIPVTQTLVLAALWFVGSACIGAGCGVLGALVHATRPISCIGSVALVSGAVAAETLLYLYQAATYLDEIFPVGQFLVLELILALLLPWLLLRERRAAVQANGVALGVALLGAVIVNTLKTYFLL